MALSLVMSRGAPKGGTSFAFINSCTHLAVDRLAGFTIGHPVKCSMYTSKNCLPFWVVGNGPWKSIKITLSKTLCEANKKN